MDRLIWSIVVLDGGATFYGQIDSVGKGVVTLKNAREVWFFKGVTHTDMASRGLNAAFPVQITGRVAAVRLKGVDRVYTLSEVALQSLDAVPDSAYSKAE